MRSDACSCYRLTARRKQRGAVLVLAMVVVILVSALAVTMASQLELNTRQGANRLYGGQAREYLLGAESLGLAVLARDSRRSDQVDHLSEDWARHIADFPVEGGWVRAGLEDAQARLNLNALADPVRGRSVAIGEAARFTPVQRRFIRLLQTFEGSQLGQVEAIAITEAVIDWLDGDDEITGFGGAETDYYLQLPEPYRPANRAMADSSELRRVRYMTDSLYRELSPYVTVLASETKMNINTVPIKLMQSINRQSDLNPMDPYAAERIVGWREEAKGFGSIENFLRHEQVQALNGKEDMVVADGLDVRSDFFLLHAESEVLGRYRSRLSLLLRDAAGGRVLRRSNL